MRVASLEVESGLGAYHEESLGLMETEKTHEVHIAAIHNVDGPWHGRKYVENSDIVTSTVGNMNKLGDITAQVEQGVQSYGAFRLLIMCPGKEAQAQIDQRRIQRVSRLDDNVLMLTQ